MEEGTTSPSRKRRCVALAGNTDNVKGKNSAIVIGDCISDSAIITSGLLSGIEDTDGLASLPSHLSPADIRLWETAQFVEDGIPLDELVTVLKVADALGDANVPKWLNKLTSMVAENHGMSLIHDDSRVCSLFRLPQHLLHPLLASALDLNGCSPETHLWMSLSLLPAALHSDIMSAAARPGHFSFCHHNADKVLPMLPTIKVPKAGLLSIMVTPGARVEPKFCAFCSCSSTGALLARAASAHPSLTSLSLKSAPLSPQWLRSFSDCLAPGALPALVSLTLCADAHPGGCAEVAACLRLLPSLTSLDISFSIQPKPAPATLSLASYAKLAGNPAPLPRLEHLAYTDGTAQCPEVCSFHWTIRSSARDSCAPKFLSLFHAPALKTLDFTPLSQQPLEALLQQAPRYSSLQALSVSVADLPKEDQPPSSADQVHQLPSLENLTVTSPSAVSLMRNAATVAQLAPASLTFLMLCEDTSVGKGPQDPEPHSDEQPTADPQVLTQAWSGVIETLGRFTGLKSLSLECLCGVEGSGDAEFMCTSMLVAVLNSSPHLTYLRLQTVKGSEVMVDGALLGTALSTLTDLQYLSLENHSGRFAITPLQMLIEGCGQLQHATQVDLMIAGIAAAHVADLLQRLPSLKEVNLWDHEFVDENREAVEALQAQYSNVTIALI